jgi:Calpain family cysteine protease
VAGRVARAADAARDADLRAARALRELSERAERLVGSHPARWLEPLLTPAAEADLAVSGVRLPVDPAAVRAGVAALTAASPSRTERDRAELVRVGAVLTGLTLTEREAVLGALPPGALAALGHRLGSGGGGMSDRLARLRVASLLAASAPPSVLPALLRADPSLEPSLAGVGPARYAVDHAPLVADGISGADPRQGHLGDCYLIAALIALARGNPNIARANMRTNPNGTVTVILHPDGTPVPVTVTRDLPTVGARGDGDDWAGVYEKAYASLRGGYRATVGGTGQAALQLITGRAADRWNPDHHDAAQVRGLLAGGFAVTVATPGGKTLGLFGKDAGPLVAAHEYVVEAVDDAGMVTLANPWGRAYDMRLPWSVVRAHTVALSLCPTR